MSPSLRAASAFVAAGVAAWLFTPVAIRAAIGLGFLDEPAGYKGHRSATPYLGGTAIFAALLAADLAVGRSIGSDWPLLACAAGLWALGTVDDRVNVPVLARVGVEVGIAVALWAVGDGWHIFRDDLLNLPLTIAWIVGVVNAFNLMDNMDGAAASAAAVSVAGAGALCLILGNGHAAPLCFAVAGACAGFLPYNLARPARVFMGDGGSLPLGLLVGVLTISAVHSSYDKLGPTGVIVGGLLVGLVILDTSLVTYSRARGRRPLFSGARDHLTHRVVERIGSARSVAAVLAASQLAICGLAIGVARAGVGWVLLAGGVVIAFGAALIWQFEHASLLAGSRRPRSSAPAARVRPEADSRGHDLSEPHAERALA